MPSRRHAVICQHTHYRTAHSTRARAPQHALGIDEEEPAERDALVLDEDAVVARDAHAAVRDERELEVGAEPACLAVLRGPGEVGVLRVGGDACGQAGWVSVARGRGSGGEGVGRTEDGGVEGCELRERVVEGEDLGRADERKVPIATSSAPVARAQRGAGAKGRTWGRTAGRPWGDDESVRMERGGRARDACLPLAEVVGERDLLEEAADDGLRCEGGRGLLDGGDHDNFEREGVDVAKGRGGWWWWWW